MARGSPGNFASPRSPFVLIGPPPVGRNRNCFFPVPDPNHFVIWFPEFYWSPTNGHNWPCLPCKSRSILLPGSVRRRVVKRFRGLPLRPAIVLLSPLSQHLRRAAWRNCSLSHTSRHRDRRRVPLEFSW